MSIWRLSVGGSFLPISHIGEPAKEGQHVGIKSLYFLWSVDRVAMHYGLETIGKMDWYDREVDQLLANQNGEGAWYTGGHPGPNYRVDTCFAPLILQRANLVADLTDNLHEYVPVRDPDVFKNIVPTQPQ